MSLSLIIELLKSLPSLISIVVEIAREFQKFKPTTVSPKPAKAFVLAKLINKPVAAPVPVGQIAREKVLGSAATQDGKPLTETPDQYNDDVKRMQDIAKGDF